jgi:hypothetical protein
MGPGAPCPDPRSAHRVKIARSMPIPPLPQLSLAKSEKSGRHVVLGHDIPKPRLTLAGLFLCVAYLGLPVVILGNLLDLVFQLLFGWCIGVWCLFPS